MSIKTHAAIVIYASVAAISPRLNVWHTRHSPFGTAA
jgi:hypothetical protein